MKEFQAITFDFEQYKSELDAFKQLLSAHTKLDERKDILSFFPNHLQLASQIASLYLQVQVDCYAFEYDLFGDFVCDLVLGNKKNQHWVFIEFEAAQKNSIFKQQGKKYQAEYSQAFERGYSQIVDWFYTLKDQQRTNVFEQRFGSQEITYHGMLIIGRNTFLDTHQRKRLRWRTQFTSVDSKQIDCMTYDDLLETLTDKLTLLQTIHKTT